MDAKQRASDCGVTFMNDRVSMTLSTGDDIKSLSCPDPELKNKDVPISKSAKGLREAVEPKFLNVWFTG